MARSVPLKDFVNFAVGQFDSKPKAVQDWIDKPGYEPMRDFYKKLREGIVGFHKGEVSSQYLYRMSENLSDPKKVKHFPILLDSYLDWLEGKEVEMKFGPEAITVSKKVRIIKQADSVPYRRAWDKMIEYYSELRNNGILDE